MLQSLVFALLSVFLQFESSLGIECSAGSYDKSGTCTPCPPFMRCSTCVANANIPTAVACTGTCPGTLKLSPHTQLCTECVDGQYFTGSSCVTCPTTLGCSDCGNIKLVNAIYRVQLNQTGKPYCLLCPTNKQQVSFFDGKCYSSCLDTQYLKNDGSCQACPTGYGCMQCVSYPKPTDLSPFVSCSSCTTAGQWISSVDGKCYASCADGKYLDSSNVCTACPAALSCDNTQIGSCLFSVLQNRVICQKCVSGKIIFPLTGACVTPCAASQYLDSKSTCVNCPLQCNGCKLLDSGKLQCLTCSVSGAVLDQGDCKVPTQENCPQGQYKNTAGVCIQCGLDFCVACALPPGNTYPSCTLCKQGYNLVDKACAQQSCASTQFRDLQGVCRDCPATRALSCQTCQMKNNANNQPQIYCLTCLDPSIKPNSNGVCMICPAQQYKDSTSQTCKACPDKCSTCFETQSKEVACSKCSSSAYQLAFNGKCLLACSTGQFRNQTDAQCYSCKDYGCGTMCVSTKTSVICQSCPTGLLLSRENRTCIQGTCPDSWGCTTCLKNDNLGLKCGGCSKPGFVVNFQGICVKCKVANCLGCTYSYSNSIETFTCGTCGTGYTLSNGICNFNANSITCPPNQIVDIRTKLCKPCAQLIKGCTTCSLASGSVAPQCTACMAGSTLENGACTLTCSSIDENCVTCNVLDGRFRCSSCAATYVLYNSKQACIYTSQCCKKPTVCASGQFDDGSSCKSCGIENCAACQFDPKQNAPQCNWCQTGFAVNKGQCVESTVSGCQGPTAAYSSKCYPCPQGCKACATTDGSTFTCSECTPGFNLADNTCSKAVTTCSVDEFQSSNSKCVKCSNFGCAECTASRNQIMCTKCPDGYTLQQDKGSCCKDGCEPGFVAADCKCLKCPQFCDTCVVEVDASNAKNTVCTDCVSPYTLDANKNCVVSSCSAKFILDNNSCKKCPADCTTCQVTTNTDKTKAIKCATCDTGFALDATLQDGLCQKTCSVGQYFGISPLFDRICLACPYQCSKCRRQNRSFLPECTECTTPADFSLKDGLCLPTTNTTQICSQGQVFLTNPINNLKQCISCPLGCTDCNFDPYDKRVVCRKCNGGFSPTPKMQCKPNAETTNPSITCLSTQFYGPTTTGKLGCNTCLGDCNSCKFNFGSYSLFCISCATATNIPQGAICMENCPKGQFSLLDKTANALTCVDCSSDCSACTLDSVSGQEQCLQCIPGFLSMKGKCIQATPSNFGCTASQFLYVDKLKQQINCLNCPAVCTACKLEDIENIESMSCSSCATDYTLLKTMKICTKEASVQNCAVGQIRVYNVGNGAITCQNCPSNCNNCERTKDGTIVCSKDGCVGTYFTNSNGVCQRLKTCTSGTFNFINLKTLEDSCEPCPQGCTVCSAPNPNNKRQIICTSCNQPTYSLNGGDCQLAEGQTPVCSSTQVLIAGKDGQKSCINCKAPCATCAQQGTAGDPLKCSSCIPGTKLVNGNCINPCGTGAYFDTSSGSCLNCHASCRNCKSAAKTDCLNCAFGFYENGGLCVKQQTARSKQLACPTNSYYSKFQDKCVCFENNIPNMAEDKCLSLRDLFQICPAKTFQPDPSSTDCAICLSNNDEQGLCLACIGPGKGDCRKCISGYYLDQTRSCMPCSANCEVCENKLICHRCAVGFYQVHQLKNGMIFTYCSATVPLGFTINLFSVILDNKDILTNLETLVNQKGVIPQSGDVAVAYQDKQFYTNLKQTFLGQDSTGRPTVNGALVRVGVFPCRQFCSVCAPGFIFNRDTGDCYQGSKCPYPMQQATDADTGENYCTFPDENSFYGQCVVKNKGLKGVSSTREAEIVMRTNKDSSGSVTYSFKACSVTQNVQELKNDNIIPLDDTSPDDEIDLSEGDRNDFMAKINQAIKDSQVDEKQQFIKIKPGFLTDYLVLYICCTASDDTSTISSTARVPVVRSNQNETLEAIGVTQKQWSITPEIGQGGTTVFSVYGELSIPLLDQNQEDLSGDDTRDTKKQFYSISVEFELQPIKADLASRLIQLGQPNPKIVRTVFDQMNFNFTGKLFNVEVQYNVIVTLKLLYRQQVFTQSKIISLTKTTISDLQYRPEILNFMKLNTDQVVSSQDLMSVIYYLEYLSRKNIREQIQNIAINPTNVSCAPDNGCSGHGNCTQYKTTRQMYCICNANYSGYACQFKQNETLFISKILTKVVSHLNTSFNTFENSQIIELLAKCGNHKINRDDFLALLQISLQLIDQLKTRSDLEQFLRTVNLFATVIIKNSDLVIGKTEVDLIEGRRALQSMIINLKLNAAKRLSQFSDDATDFDSKQGDRVNIKKLDKVEASKTSHFSVSISNNENDHITNSTNGEVLNTTAQSKTMINSNLIKNSDQSIQAIATQSDSSQLEDVSSLVGSTLSISITNEDGDEICVNDSSNESINCIPITGSNSNSANLACGFIQYGDQNPSSCKHGEVVKKNTTGKPTFSTEGVRRCKEHEEDGKYICCCSGHFTTFAISSPVVLDYEIEHGSILYFNVAVIVVILLSILN